jgi:hypothetical protein
MLIYPTDEILNTLWFHLLNSVFNNLLWSTLKTRQTGSSKRTFASNDKREAEFVNISITKSKPRKLPSQFSFWPRLNFNKTFAVYRSLRSCIEYTWHNCQNQLQILRLFKIHLPFSFRVLYHKRDIKNTNPLGGIFHIPKPI